MSVSVFTVTDRTVLHWNLPVRFLKYLPILHLSVHLSTMRHNRKRDFSTQSIMNVHLSDKCSDWARSPLQRHLPAGEPPLCRSLRDTGEGENKKTQVKTLPSQVPRHIRFWTRAKDETLRIFCFFSFQTESNIFRNLSVDQYKRIREGIIKWDHFSISTECARCLILDMVGTALHSARPADASWPRTWRGTTRSSTSSSPSCRLLTSPARSTGTWWAECEPSLQKVLKSSRLFSSFGIAFSVCSWWWFSSKWATYPTRRGPWRWQSPGWTACCRSSTTRC